MSKVHNCLKGLVGPPACESHCALTRCSRWQRGIPTSHLSARTRLPSCCMCSCGLTHAWPSHHQQSLGYCLTLPTSTGSSVPTQSQALPSVPGTKCSVWLEEGAERSHGIRASQRWPAAQASGSCQQQEKLCRSARPALIEGPVPSLTSPFVLLAIRAHPDSWSHFPTKSSSLAQLPPRPVISVLWCGGSHRAPGACCRRGIVLVQSGFLLSWSC